MNALLASKLSRTMLGIVSPSQLFSSSQIRRFANGPNPIPRANDGTVVVLGSPVGSMTGRLLVIPHVTLDNGVLSRLSMAPDWNLNLSVSSIELIAGNWLTDAGHYLAIFSGHYEAVNRNRFGNRETMKPRVWLGFIPSSHLDLWAESLTDSMTACVA